MQRKRRTRTEMLEVVESWDLVPLEPYPGAHKRWPCWCRRCESVVRPLYSVMTMARTRNACPECNRRHKREFLKTAHEDMVTLYLSRGFQPIGRYPGNHEPWPSIHLACMQECAPYPANVKARGGGCERCAREVRGRKRRVDEAVAIAVMRHAGLEPLVAYPTSGIPWKCMCIACHVVTYPTYDNVRAGNGGCLHCAPFGLGWDEEALVYLLVHPAHLSLKVGVAKLKPAQATNARVDLLARRYGWHRYRELAVPTGREAFRIEQAILRWWRSDLGFPAHLGREETDGHTETVSLEAVSAHVAWQRILTTTAAGRDRGLGRTSIPQT